MATTPKRIEMFRDGSWLYPKYAVAPMMTAIVQMSQTRRIALTGTGISIGEARSRLRYVNKLLSVPIPPRCVHLIPATRFQFLAL